MPLKLSSCTNGKPRKCANGKLASGCPICPGAFEFTWDISAKRISPAGDTWHNYSGTQTANPVYNASQQAYPLGCRWDIFYGEETNPWARMYKKYYLHQYQVDWYWVLWVNARRLYGCPMTPTPCPGLVTNYPSGFVRIPRSALMTPVEIASQPLVFEYHRDAGDPVQNVYDNDSMVTLSSLYWTGTVIAQLL